MKDDERSGGPTTSRTDDSIAAVDKTVKEDRNVTSLLTADTFGIPKTVVLRILREDLKKRKLCSRFVPHALTREHTDERVSACQDLLNMINGDKNFLDKVITGDESLNRKKYPPSFFSFYCLSPGTLGPQCACVRARACIYIQGVPGGM